MLKGRLLFHGWNERPWALTTAHDIEVDLFPLVDALLTELAGVPLTQHEDLDSYSLTRDGDGIPLVYRDGRAWLEERKPVRFLNVAYFIALAFERLNGRLVHMTLNAAGLTISADPREEVLRLADDDSGSELRPIPIGSEYSVCKFGNGPETCLFLAVAPEEFRCLKFSRFGSEMLVRGARGETTAKRIGNCGLCTKKGAAVLSVR